MLVAPDDEVQETGQHLLVDAGFCEHAPLVALVPILVQDHDVEPVLWVRWRLEADLPCLEGPMQPLVADVSQAVDRQLCSTLAEQHRLYDYVLEILGAPKVVHQAGHLQEVARTEVGVSTRVVVVAMDHEEGDLHVGVHILVVDEATGKDGGIADHLEENLSRSKAISPEQVHGPVQGASGRLVLVKEVTAMEDEIGFLGSGELQDLLERVQRICTADLVLLTVSDMGVGSNQNAEGIIVLRTLLRHAICRV
mmetsp:Transcript_116158/g.339718  ORF Transcript_116158/g.339718 Transcript_116158/m.339718 type:complete len:252 (+) Transcript_116158:895-1650(+)